MPGKDDPLPVGDNNVPGLSPLGSRITNMGAGQLALEQQGGQMFDLSYPSGVLVHRGVRLDDVTTAPLGINLQHSSH